MRSQFQKQNDDASKKILDVSGVRASVKDDFHFRAKRSSKEIVQSRRIREYLGNYYFFAMRTVESGAMTHL
jgi:hypothetical protein